MPRSPFIETFTGRRFEPLNPSRFDIDIQDIAHALSHQCRFSGHTKTFYSVAEHSWRVATLLEEQGFSKGEQLAGLLHDASEAYLVDLPSPLKDHPALGDAYKAAEELLMHEVARRFDLPSGFERWALVKQADGMLLSTEARDLMAHLPEYWEGRLQYAPMSERIKPYSSAMAKQFFLTSFEELIK